jgi:hypothetical protein
MYDADDAALRHPPPPLVVMSYMWITDPQDAPMSWAVGLTRQACVPGWRSRLNHTDTRALEDVLSGALAAHYAWSALSLRDAMRAGQRAGLPEALNLTACEYASALLNDQIHPSPAGARLMGDALIELLDRAVAAYNSTREGEGEDDVAPALPASPFTRGAWAPGGHSRCTDAAHFALVREEHAGEAAWAFVESEEVRDAATGATRRVDKPGLVTTTPDAEVTLALSTRFARTPRAANVTLVAHFLQSYERMGDATLRCVAGCACDALLLRGSASQLFSVAATAAVNVTQSARCRLRATCAPSPRGAKCKLLRLVVQTLHAAA